MSYHTYSRKLAFFAVVFVHALAAASWATEGTTPSATAPVRQGTVGQGTVGQGSTGEGRTANDKIAQEISDTTMSPFCPGRTISACPSGQAWELRQKIHTWLAEGLTAEAVRNQLMVLYGEGVRGTPREDGFGLVGWFAPGIFVLLGVGAIVFVLRKQRLKPSGPTQPTADPSTLNKIEDELKRRAGH